MQTITGDFYLRNVMQTMDDHEWLVRLHNDPIVLHNLTDPRPITFESHMLWWYSLNEEKQIRKIFCKGDNRIGFCKFINIDRENNNCLLGADIAKEERGKHYAKPMWKLMIGFAFNELGLYRVGLTTAEYNEIGRKLYNELGFKEEGRLVKSLFRNGHYFDQVCMYMTKEDWK